MRRSLLLATSNLGKAAEFQDLLGEHVRLLSLNDVDVDMPEETGETFEENAELKATSVARQSGMVTLADDSGLTVDALHGKPGVHSARFAGPRASDTENRIRLLTDMAGISLSDRGARFVCALCLATPDGQIWTRVGVLEGMIADRERGAFGFGYDSLFETTDGRTLAELPAVRKNAISHRARAILAILPRIELLLENADRSIGASLRRGDPS